VGDDSRVQRWEQRGQVPLFTASLLYLTAYTVRVLATDLSEGWRDFWLAITLATWVAFAADYAVRLALSRRRWAFVRRRWLDLIVLALPVLRPLRMVQVYAAAQARRPHPRLSLEGQVMAQTALTTLLLGFLGSLAAYQAERDAAGATIRSFGDALWWTCVTLSTTGYGDVFPVTPRGRLVGVALMAVGVGLIGAVVGLFSSLLVERFRQRREEAARPRESE
jgi:voltage-gated potassium channel